ncbi:unnamed protein product, partial [Prorocentrum cordatum]
VAALVEGLCGDRGAESEQTLALAAVLAAESESAMTSRSGRVPGRRVLVRFEGDTYSHERLLLWPTRKDSRFEGWVILTADDDLHIEWTKDWVWIYDLTEAPPADLRGGVVRFRGAMTAGEVLARVLEGRDEAMKYRAKRGLPERLGGRFGEGPTSFLDWNGRELVVEDCGFGRVKRRLTSKGVSSELRAAEASGDEAATRPVLADAADDGVEVVNSVAAALVPSDGSAGPSGPSAGSGGMLGDCVYVVAEVRAPHGMRLGDPVVGGRTVGQGSFRALVQLESGGYVMCERVPTDSVEIWRRAAIEAASEYRLPLPPSGGEPGAARENGGRSGDLRAEFAAADTGAERTGGTATPPAQEAEAEGDARTLCVEWTAEGARFKSWRKAVDESSQLTFEGCELRGANTCLHLCRRFVQHTGDPKMWLLTFCREHGISVKASWESARYLTGVVDPFDVVSPELRSFANRAARDEAERQAAAARGRVAGARQELEETGAALALGGLPGAKDDARGAAAKAKAKARAGAGAVDEAGGAGEYFPVPEVQQLDPDIGFGLTRREKLRVRRLANDAIESLSWMHGARWREASRAQPRLATYDKVAGLRRDTKRRAQLAAAGWRRSSSATSSQQALAQLLRGHGPYAETRANLASFVHDRLSIPEGVRSPEEVAVLDKALGPVRPYTDPVLKSNRKVYLGLVKRLLRIGLVRLSASKKCDVGVFVVKNKDCFHRLRFPKESKLDEYFTYPEVWASELGLTWWEGRHVEKDMLLYPLAQSLPMGWAWSLYFAQEANTRQIEMTKELRDAHLLQDRGLPLVLQGGGGDAGRGKYCYVDNLGVLADDEEYVRKGLTAVTETFGSQGLAVHKTDVACECGVVLGIEVDGARGRTRPTAKRFWRVRDSIQEVLRRGVCSGQELEVLVGHMTFVVLIRRELLSILQGTYRFVKKLYYEKAPLWQCVKDELKAFCGAMVFLEAKWDDQWLPGVYQTDASPWGFGVAYSQWPEAAVADAGRVPERARFRLGAEAARSHAFAAAGLEEREDGLLQARAKPTKDEALRWERDRSFPELPAHLLHGSRWSTVMADKWRYEEGIIHLDARAALKGIERLARSRHGHDARALFVGDNLALTLALGRSRSRDFKLLTLIRRAGSLALARGLRLVFRWVPSELNSSDKGSRLFDRDYDEKKDATWSMRSTMTNGLKTGIKMASQMITSMIETDERVQRGAVGRSRTLAAAGEKQGRARSRSSRRARTLTAARATSLQSRLEAPALEPNGSLEAEARVPARAADAGSTVGDDESDSASEEAVAEADRKEERLARQRARRRVARMAEGKTTMLPGQSYLEAASVSEANRVRYRSFAQELLDFADRESMALCEDGEVDECLVARMNLRYQLGDRVWRGEYMVAAMMFAFPSFGRGGSRHVPRTLQCLRGWGKLCPKFSRRPLPWAVWSALALELLRSGHGRAGSGVLLMVDAYLRPSELLSLRRGSLVAPARGGPTDWSLHLFPQEEIKRSKVGGADDTVVMNSERMRWADSVFAYLAKGSSAEKLFPWDYQQFGRLVRVAGDRLRIPVVPYQARHSGISLDRAFRLRSQEEAMKRGRWSSFRSIVRYEKTGHLNEAWRRLDPDVQAFALVCEERLEDVFLRGAPLLARPCP